MKQGIYRGVLELREGIELPFNFEVKYKNRKPQFVIHNADERITVDEITVKGDSIIIKMPVFDTEFHCVMEGNNLKGVWINNYRTTENKIPFKAEFGNTQRFANGSGISVPAFNGKWEVTFSPGSEDSTLAIGVFNHVEQTDQVTGTFLTETGDYRFLEGIKRDNELLLSTFDGSHAYLFRALLKDGKLEGTFYSGSHWKETFTGFKNDKAQLKDAEELTYVKNPQLPIAFSFRDLKQNSVSLSDKRFENKPVIIQLMGSWCPNCFDESAYLSGVYEQYKNSGLEIIAVSFEKTTDPQKATAQVSRLINRLNISYPVLLSLQTGKDKASEVFPGLSKILAFPTTIFLNRQHQVVKIHTGFSGPATGNDYVIFKERTENLIKTLLRD